MIPRPGWAFHVAMVGALGLLGGCSHSGGSDGGQGGSSTAVGGSDGDQGGSSTAAGGSGGVGLSASGGANRGGGGSPGSGGRPSTGGTSSTGGGGASGTSSAGGISGSCPGSCAPATPASCSSPKTRITQVSLGSTLSYSADETYVVPLAIAAKPGGGSLVAWVTGYSHYGSSSTSQVHIGELDCNDQLVGTPFTLEGHDFQDLAADASGGVVVVTRDAQSGPDAQHCGDVGNLCVTPTDRPGCYDTYMVRFDCAGTQQWATKLTTSSATVPPYTSGSGNNYFVWWYQHHGRLAYDGTNYAAYFCDAITVTNNACSAKVDIHEGDRMQVVGPTGSLVTGHDSFALGCSHSWTARIVWDPRTNHFVMACATDNNCRMAQPNPYRTIVSATCDGTLFGGDIVNASVAGYWIAWSYQGSIRLEHFTTGASDKSITTAGTAQNPHLVSLGANRMLLTWKSGSSLAAQVYDSGTGATIGTQFTIAVADHPWQSWKPFPDGSAAYAAVGSASSTIQIVRVMPCSD